MREIESSSYLARLKAEAKEKLKKKEKDGSTHTDPPVVTASTSSAGAALPAMNRQEPTHDLSGGRAWASGNTWERETKQDLQKMNATLKKGLDPDFAHLLGYDSDFLESLEHDDPQDGSYLYRYLSCMFPKNPLGPQDRPKHIPKILVEEKCRLDYSLLSLEVLEEKKC